ncbi:hypothetical protein I302_104389 [Kwoniella bestiolae CBS 10118]|uniref:Uncharacterized protein n=1 Tax=Kwoniella bestiolae CBS 10118 TaxID=1296100 RepID=A0A1B9GB50_9TREE|nr:hypothetical protein I302_03095 [Kwoniella bestiolae CBS 10118]OCF28243.1 hypothetical protein I302_03095 [Kwoniella bestiolae CBS 10118]
MSKSKSKTKGKKRAPPSSPNPESPITKSKSKSKSNSSIATIGRIDFTLLSLHTAPDQNEDEDEKEEKKKDYPARNTRSKVAITPISLTPTPTTSRPSSLAKLELQRRPVPEVGLSALVSESSSPFSRLGDPRPRGISYAKAANLSSSSSSSSSSNINPPTTAASTSSNHPNGSSSGTPYSASTPPIHTHDQIEAECIICSEEMSEICLKLRERGKVGEAVGWDYGAVSWRGAVRVSEFLAVYNPLSLEDAKYHIVIHIVFGR